MATLHHGNKQNKFLSFIELSNSWERIKVWVPWMKIKYLTIFNMKQFN